MTGLLLVVAVFAVSVLTVRLAWFLVSDPQASRPRVDLWADLADNPGRPINEERRPTYVSPVDPIIEAHAAGEMTNEAAFSALMGLGDLRSGMYDESGRCRHLGPYPGCSGGCNGGRNRYPFFGGDR